MSGALRALFVLAMVGAVATVGVSAALAAWLGVYLTHHVRWQ